MKKENDVSDKKEEVLCRLRRVARASTEEKYHSAVNDLLTSDVWKHNPKLCQWFGNKWLKSKEVIFILMMSQTMLFILQVLTDMEVVMIMGVPQVTDKISRSTLTQNKIPDYARDYRNEYLFIRGIDETCENFVKKLGREEIFKSPQADSLMRYFNRFLKAQELDYLSDTSKIFFKYKDVISIESLELQLDDYMSLFCDPDSYEFDEEKYINNIENDYPGFKNFFECFSRFYDKLNIAQMSEEDYYKSIIFNSDSDTDSDSDSDDDVIYSDSDSDEIVSDSVRDEYKKEFYELLYGILND